MPMNLNVVWKKISLLPFYPKDFKQQKDELNQKICIHVEPDNSSLTFSYCPAVPYLWNIFCLFSHKKKGYTAGQNLISLKERSIIFLRQQSSCCCLAYTLSSTYTLTHLLTCTYTLYKLIFLLKYRWKYRLEKTLQTLYLLIKSSPFM